MKKWFRVRSALAALSVVGMLNPAAGLAAGPIAPVQQATAQQVVDVALHQDGVLMGKVVTPTGAAIPKSVVQISQKGKVLQTVHTDENGMFVAKSMRGGVYNVQTAQTTRQVRAWTPGAAPPAAQRGILLVQNVDPEVVRGQLPPEPSPIDLNGNGSITEEVIVGTAVVGGVTAGVIIAVEDDDEGSP